MPKSTLAWARWCRWLAAALLVVPLLADAAQADRSPRADAYDAIFEATLAAAQRRRKGA